ncbi:MAG: hypothetical protein ABGX04_02775 [Myxococcales bacterium]|nr:hypothetical protein [Myxococcales bacterium]HIK85145.1 hypothetical protein [Myxococcales bacterium]
MTEASRDPAQEKQAHAELSSMIRDAAIGPAAITALLDGLTSETRAPVVRSLGKSDQGALYTQVEGYAPLDLEDLVPPTRADLEEVRHLGRNSLPAFRIFEKRFCRQSGSSPEAPKELAGYNYQRLSALTGPGYFGAISDDNTREVLVDYARLPNETPPGWPPVRSNEGGLSRFVYGFMIDRLRRVSEHVTIGSAARNGKDLGSYFVLCRID